MNRQIDQSSPPWARILQLALLFLPMLLSPVFAQTPAQGPWVPKAPMLTPRFFAAYGVIDGKLYVAGGIENTSGAPGYVSDKLEVYDPMADKWEPRSRMPLARRNTAGGVIDGKLYVFGGVNETNSGSTNTLFVYDPVTDTWSIKTPLNPPTPGNSHSAAVINGKLYVVGGSIGIDVNRTNVEIYDPVADSWSSGAPIPTPRNTLAAAALGGKLYTMGGFLPPCCTSLKTVEIYDPAINTWSSGPDLPEGRNQASGEALNGNIYLIGGINGDGTGITNTVFRYDPASNAWSKGIPMGNARYTPSVGAAGGNLYVAGGCGSTCPTPVVEAFTSICTQPTWAGLKDGLPQNVPLSSSNPANRWTMQYSVSDKAGLVLSNIKLGSLSTTTSRYMARQFSLPHYSLNTASGPNNCSLTPDGIGSVCRSRLVDLTQDTKGDPMVIEATYAVDMLPDDPTGSICLMLKQRYEFLAEVFPSSPFSADACELSGTVSCARFYPKISYDFNAPPGTTYPATIKTIQRLHFVASKDETPEVTNHAAIFHDCNSLIDVVLRCSLRGGKVDRIIDATIPLIANPLPSEVAVTIFQKDNNLFLSDNYHQTYKPRVSEPGGALQPGCPECVHMHWRWSDISSLPGFGSQFGGGRPLIPNSQTVQIAVVLANGPNDRDLPEPFAAINPGNAASLGGHGKVPVLWYGASSDQASDEFFGHGAFFSSSISKKP
jgi:N-acetylneuraminic acid mutarotase